MGAEAQLLKLIEINWVLGWVCGSLPAHWLGVLVDKTGKAWLQTCQSPVLQKRSKKWWPTKATPKSREWCG